VPDQKAAGIWSYLYGSWFAFGVAAGPTPVAQRVDDIAATGSEGAPARMSESEIDRELRIVDESRILCMSQKIGFNFMLLKSRLIVGYAFLLIFITTPRVAWGQSGTLMPVTPSLGTDAPSQGTSGSQAWTPPDLTVNCAAPSANWERLLCCIRGSGFSNGLPPSYCSGSGVGLTQSLGSPCQMGTIWNGTGYQAEWGSLTFVPRTAELRCCPYNQFATSCTDLPSQQSCSVNWDPCEAQTQFPLLPLLGSVTVGWNTLSQVTSTSQAMQVFQTYAVAGEGLCATVTRACNALRGNTLKCQELADALVTLYTDQTRRENARKIIYIYCDACLAGAPPVC
jgi:hypothetical protein